MLSIRTIATIVLVLGLIVGAGWAWQYYLQSVAIECGETKETQDHNATEQKGGVIQGTPLDHLLPSDRRSNKPAEPKDTRYECLIAKYTSQLAAFTEALAYATALLVVATAGLIILGLFQFWDARAVQRAYVYVLAVRHKFVFDQAGNATDLQVWPTFKNSGTTAGSANTTSIGVTFAPQLNQFVFGQPAGGYQQPFVFGPGQELDVGAGFLNIGIRHIGAAAAGTGHQFIWGWVRYRDRFSSTTEHVIEFCYKLCVEGTLPPGQCTIHFDPYGPHNREYDERVS